MASRLVAEAQANTGLNLGGLPLRVDVLVFLVVCFAFVYLHLFILPATPILYEEDHLYMLHDAWRMYEGELIYRDFFQIMYPGTQLFYLLFFYIFGLRFWIVDAIILIQAMVSVILCLAISRRIIGDVWYAYLPPALYLFFGFRWFGIDGNHRVFSPIFALLTVYVLFKERSYKRIIAAGILAAVTSFFTQQRGVVAIGAVGIFLIIEGISRRDKVVEVLKRCAAAAVAYGVTLTILISPFVIATGPRKFFDYTLFFISSYAQDPAGNYGAYLLGLQTVLSMGYLITASMLLYYALIPLVYVVAIAYLWFTRKRQEPGLSRDAVLLLCLLGLGLSAATFAPNPSRLFQIAAPAVIVFGWLLYQLRPALNIPVRIAVIALTVFGFGLAVRTQTQWEPAILAAPTGNIAFLSPVTLEKYAWLRTNARPEDTVFEVYNCAVNFPLLLRNPTEATQLFNTGYSPSWQVAGVIDSLEAEQARFIIWDATWDSEMAELREGERLKPLHKYLNERYEMKAELTPYSGRRPQIWERK
jgi:hypothetical protein